jgi:hypothetical protein
MNSYIIEMKTAKDLGKETFVRNLIHSWIEGREDLRPERFGSGEPVRYSIAERGVESVVQMWLATKRPVMLKRISQPKFDVDMSWRPAKGKDPREFPWHCCVFLSEKAGDALAKYLFDFLLEHFEPAYGLVSTYEHNKDKHFVKFKNLQGGTTEHFVGHDVLTQRPGLYQKQTFPGIYWLTYFSNEMVNRIGRDKFDDMPTAQVCRHSNGMLIQAYEKCFKIDKDSEDIIASHLGKDLFFDKEKYIRQNALEVIS